MGFTVEVGIAGGATAFPAQAGRGTGFVCFGAKDSAPRRKPSAATGAPDGRGVSTATVAVSLTRYSLATRFTSATATFFMASMSSSGEVRPSTARAWDQAMASPVTEFFSNSASAIS